MRQTKKENKRSQVSGRSRLEQEKHQDISLAEEMREDPAYFD